ncbi:MAG: flagellar hook protein FlgE [Xanthomonadaceae bacterium]|nr:flagellar hook protein FlgE [Xanthomonadaceae bacterium]
MPFRTALSGLNASSAELRVIGNNVANASTTGFKESRAEFADIFASSNLGVTSNAIGSGVRVSSVSQQFTQGNIGFTDNNLDLAISGQGFLIMNDNGVNAYTRAGAMSVDRDGYVVNSQGQRLTVFSADNNGTITGATGDLQLDRSDIAPVATTRVDMSANLNAAAAVPGGLTGSSTLSLTGTLLDEDDSPVLNIAISDVVDSWGQDYPGATLSFAYSGDGTNNLWDITFNDGVNPAVTVAGVDVGTDNEAVFSWDPDGLGSMNATDLTLDIAGLSPVLNGGGVTDLASADSNGSTQAAFDPTDASTYNNSTSVTVYDSLGASHLSTMYFRKTGIPNQWEVYSYLDGVAQGGAQTVQFDSSGNITSGGQVTVGPASVNTGAADLTFTVDFTRTTQYGSGFNVNAMDQDGFTTGRLSGIDISDTGVITSRFTNGQSRTLGQIALANFNNTQGLRQLGDTSWSESFDSGQPLVGTAGSGSLGLIESGALEGSNVDLTEQLVGMITAQRNFQANAQVITTADTVTQTIINIR